MITILAIIMILLAYLCGSLCSAIIICRLFRLPDPRDQGSGNPGTTNVLRIGGKLPAALTLIFDVLKGTIPVWGSYFLGLPPLMLGLVGVAACLGHMYPIFFSFRGGKGVATALGAMFPIGFSLVGLLMATWITVAYLTRYSSMAALVTVGLAPLYTWLIKPLYTLPAIMLSALIVWRHKDNIVRLIKGREPKIGDKQKPN